MEKYYKEILKHKEDFKVVYNLVWSINNDIPSLIRKNIIELEKQTRAGELISYLQTQSWANVFIYQIL